MTSDSEVSIGRNSETSNPLITLDPNSFEENENVITSEYLHIERPIESSPRANVETYSESDESDDISDSNDTSEADITDGITIDGIGRSYLDSTYDLAPDGVEHSEESNPLLEALNDNDIMHSPGELRKVLKLIIDDSDTFSE